jgi:hypothetical protein
MEKEKTEAQNAANCQAGQSAATEVSPGSSSATTRASIHSVARNPGGATGGLSPLSVCILRLAELGRQRLAREAQARSEDVGDELPADTPEKLD